MARQGTALTHDMSTSGIASAYDRWSPIYDHVFGRVFRRGRSEAVRAAERIGGRVLEVGVGTGLSLPQYSHGCRITGVDVSPDMLAKAREKVAEHRLGHIDDLLVDDAEALSFPDASFDVVVAQYVVTAVGHPERALDEFARVCRPGGEIVIATRVSASGGLRGTIERALMPLTTRLGWRTDFPFSRYTDWAEGRADVRLAGSEPLPPLGHFSLIRFTKIDPSTRQDSSQ